MTMTDTMSDTDWAFMLRVAIEKNERERMAKEAESRAGYDPGMTHSRPSPMAPQNQAQQRIRDGWPVEDAYSVPELSLDQRIGQALGNWIDDRTATEAISMLPIPGISDAAGLKADAEYFAKNPDAATPGNVALSAAGLLPFVPAFSGVIKDLKTPAWQQHAWDGPSFPVGVNPTNSELRELFQAERGGDLRVMLPTGAGDAYFWPANAALHADVAAHFGLPRSAYEPGIVVPEDIKNL